MERKTTLACDQCHGHKLRCTPLSQGCFRCNRLGIRCTSNRPIKKRGKKPKQERLLPNIASDAPDYPILDCMQGLDVLHAGTSRVGIQLSRAEACRLLEHFYESPNQEFHTRLIRRHVLLSQRAPRPTSPTLLLSILCSTMFMPRLDQGFVLPGRNSHEHTVLRRNLFEELIRRFHPRTLPDSHHTFDDALTAFMITSIAPSEKSVESSLQYWLIFLKFIVQKLDLHIDLPHLAEEAKEERRRLWWAAYIIDRHSSFSFNTRPLLTDQECHQLPTPCSDSIWDQAGELSAGKDDTDRGIGALNYAVQSLDMFGVFIPLSRILGEILEYRFLCSSTTFNQTANYLISVRETIESNLGLWFISFHSLVGPGFAQLAADVQSERASVLRRDEPRIAYYALHLYHCMHILLYGPMDIVVMYEDLKWQASSEFVVACEHANACAKMAQSILMVDPHLSFMFRYYGTYFLQSCFMFLILAQKLGRQSDSLIISNCAINLEVLDKFILTTNMDYQHDFAKLLRKVFSNLIQDPASEDDGVVEASSLDPEMLRYRWIPGFRGLLPNRSA